MITCLFDLDPEAMKAQALINAQNAVMLQEAKVTNVKNHQRFSLD